MKQDRFDCKHLECCMDGCYCKIQKGGSFNHCVIPYYSDTCEFFEHKKSKTKINKTKQSKPKQLTPKITHTMQKVAVDILGDIEYYFMTTKEVPQEIVDIFNKHIEKYELYEDPFTHMICTKKEYFRLSEEYNKQTMIERFGYYED